MEENQRPVEKSLTKAILKESVQHPSTLYPAGISFLSGLYMALIDMSPTSLALAMGSGLLSLASFVFHYFIRGDKIGERKLKELRRQRNLRKVEEAEDIEREAKESGFREGEKEAVELREAYLRLSIFLREKLEKKRSMTAGRFMVLAEETYRQGLALIKKANRMYRALSEIDYRKLQRELKVFEKELKTHKQKGDEGSQVMIETLNSKIESHDKRIKLYEDKKQTLDQLMAQCEILEATLDSAYLEVVDLIDNSKVTKHRNVANNLEKAVQAARRVEERLMGLETKNDDSIYNKRESE